MNPIATWEPRGGAGGVGLGLDPKEAGRGLRLELAATGVAPRRKRADDNPLGQLPYVGQGEG